MHEVNNRFFGVRLKTSMTDEDQDKHTNLYAIVQSRILYSSVSTEKKWKGKL